MEKKRVSFDKETSVKEYDEIRDPEEDNQVRESTERTNLECRLLNEPSNEMERLLNLFDECRNHPTTVVFGNLGRQPHLLDYYLDLCFGSNEWVKVACRWVTPSVYQTLTTGMTTTEEDSPQVDFLFVLEPHFGASVQPRSTEARHVIILSSHLGLFLPKAVPLRFLHLSSFTTERKANRQLSSPGGKKMDGYWKPPLFHEKLKEGPLQRELLQPARRRLVEEEETVVTLDVAGAKSANEAYLRVMTGREIIGDGRAHNVSMKSHHREVIESQMRKTQLVATAQVMTDRDRVGNVYWDYWLQ